MKIRSSRINIKSIFKQFCSQNQFGSHKKYTGSIDQSTTGTKFSLFQLNGNLIDQQIVSHKQISTKPGWLEHDPSEIIENVYKSISKVVNRQQKQSQNFKSENIIGVGLCNQRQTVVYWDSKTGKPLGPAIVWSDGRTAEICHQFQQKHGQFKDITGLPVSTYFTLFKILWLLKNNPDLKQQVKNGSVRFGTIDSWVAYNLTGAYVTDSSNASRTHLCNINTGKWDKQLLDLAGIPQSSLPSIISSFQDIGPIKQGALKGIKIQSILGDQQSSAYAHNLSNKQMKITYGTGCFMLNNLGLKPQYNPSFVTTILWSKNNQINYGYQSSVQCGGGTINWAKRLNLFGEYKQLNDLPQCPEQLFFMPSFGSIFSPHWKQGTSGHFHGLSFNTTKQHLMQSILQAITFRLHDNIKDKQLTQTAKIIVDGGLCQNKNLMQMQSNVFQKQVEVRTLDTCWGVAKGVMTTLNQKIQQQKFDTVNYHPDSSKSKYYKERYQKWCQHKTKMYNL